MKNKDLDLKTLLRQASSQVEKVRRYSLVAFIIFVVALYGFVLFRINTLKDAEPSPADVASQVKADQVPHIDESVVKQLESLQDNSVNVQTLFNDARSNPFQ